MTRTAPNPSALLDDGPDPRTLERNLAALARSHAALARRLAHESPRADVTLSRAEDGAWTALLGGGSSSFTIGGVDIALDPFSTGDPARAPLQLASRRRPLEEARKLAETIDPASTGAAVVLGFALGHHVGALLTRMKGSGVVAVFEPDIPLLRAVLERVPCEEWIGSRSLRILTDPADSASITSAVAGAEAIFSLGTKFVVHPPSRSRLGESADMFASAFAQVMRAVRTNVITTFVQVEATLRNLLQNLDHYATRPGVADLAGAAAGFPAVVVSAGPSLERNIELLSRPGVRDRVAIIAVQTVLKTLLARGIRPHFVTALDHHEISRRFYEGITPEDVEGVTLVAEPKANPAILAAYPGAIRCVGDDVLDRVLGPELARPLGKLAPGATVAHLAYYLARHLGCDPVILVGQDLGFTDGQYYAAGAAIHHVWASELSEFNTLEMLEWQRIARMKSLLRRATDQLGRPIYTDEQMSTYLVQFERDFARDAARGLATIDATEGGVAKQHTTILPLAGALDRHAPPDARALPSFIRSGQTDPEPRRTVARVEGRLREIRRDVWRLGELSRETRALLESMLAVQSDQPRVNKLIAEVYSKRDQVAKLTTAYWMVEYLNQTGVFRRFRADRERSLDASLAPLERQRREIERDIDNVAWVADAADSAGQLLDDAVRALLGHAKVTRDVPDVLPADRGRAPHDTTKVAALVVVDPWTSTLGAKRDLGRTMVGGKNALCRTLERVARCTNVASIAIASPDPGRVREILGAELARRYEIHACDPAVVADHRAAVRAGRLWSRSCWRGGIAGLSCYDEVLCPKAIAPIVERLDAQGVAFIGGDWAWIDPALVDDIVARYAEAPERNKLTFSQAPPGLGACVVDRTLIAELAAHASPFASIGALLGYIPVAPQADPIAKPACAPVDPRVRDLGGRFIADDERAARTIESVLSAVAGPSAAAIADALPGGLPADELPEIIHIEFDADPAQRRETDAIVALLAQAGARPDAAVTIRVRRLAGAGPDLDRLLNAAREAGLAVHVRTDLACWSESARAIADAVDVLSVDLAAHDAATYASLTGHDEFDLACATIEKRADVRDARRFPGGLPRPWIVPRITRRDAAYAHIEPFYDQRLLRFGACVIDPLPAPIAGERIAPLPLPRSAARRFERTILRVLQDARAQSHSGALLGDLRRERLSDIWARHAARLNTQS